MKLIKLHIGLYRYLKSELKKKRTFKELIKFLKNVIVSYFKEIFRLLKEPYTYLIDKEFRKQKKEYKKLALLQKDLQRALKLLEYIDEKLDKKGYNRTERRQFWRDFYKDSRLRTEVFQDLAKEVNNWR